MLDRDSALRGSAGDIQFNQAIETSTFLPLSGGTGGGGKALFTSRNDIAGYSGRPQRDGNDPMRSRQSRRSGAIRVHSVEPPCSTDYKTIPENLQSH